MDSVEVSLFGSLRVSSSLGELLPQDFPSRKAKQVFEVLALARGKRVATDELIEVLWGDKLPKNPRGTLEQNVSVLRSCLARISTQPIIVTSSGGYALDPHVVSVDLDAFDHEVSSAAGKQPEEAMAFLRRALAFVHGDILDDEAYAEWTASVRSYYARRVDRCLVNAARLSLLTGHPTESLAFAEQAMDHAALPDELACRLAVAALIELGRRAEAKALLDDMEQQVRTVYDIGLSPETEAVRASLHVPLLDHARVVVKVDPAVSVRDRLPAVPPFVGRKHELSALHAVARRVAAGGSEFVLVVGGIGIGKSRLLREIPRPTDASCHHMVCSEMTHTFPRFAATRLYALLENSSGHSRMPVISSGDEAVTELFERLTSVLRQLGPVLVLIDDMHLIDRESLAILRALSEPGAAPGLGIIGTVRSGVAAHSAMASRPDQVIAIGALVDEDLAELGLRDALPETGGNPTLALAVLQGVAVAGTLPQSVLTYIHHRSEACGPAAGMLLAAAASAEQPFALAIAALDVGLSPSFANILLSDLVAGGVLVESGRDRYRFTESITRRLYVNIRLRQSQSVRALSGLSRTTT